MLPFVGIPTTLHKILQNLGVPIQILEKSFFSLCLDFIAWFEEDDLLISFM
jgi:hypothetical protein